VKVSGIVIRWTPFFLKNIDRNSTPHDSTGIYVETLTNNLGRDGPARHRAGGPSDSLLAAACPLAADDLDCVVRVGRRWGNPVPRQAIGHDGPSPSLFNCISRSRTTDQPAIGTHDVNIYKVTISIVGDKGQLMLCTCFPIHYIVKIERCRDA
jgi:hypothetical protein